MNQSWASTFQITGVVLASTSPRRREMLRQFGVEHIALAPEVEEKRLDGEAPEAYVLRNGRLKAQNVIERHKDLCKEAFVIASDTVVVSPNGAVLEKPQDESHAREMLLSLRGQKHEVLSSITILFGANGDLLVNEVVRTSVYFGNFPTSWLESYLRTEEPYDKAGGYGIQGLAGAFVERIEGTNSNVVGLPLFETLMHLSSLSNVRRFFQNQSQTASFAAEPMLAISKGSSPAAIRLAATFGQKDFGENYLQELHAKQQELRDTPWLRWHFTGNLQSNKIDAIVQSCEVVHSLASLEKAAAINKACQKYEKRIEVFLKVATAGHTQASSGLDWQEAERLLDQSNQGQLPHLRIMGFMGMAPIGLSEHQTLALFEDWLSKAAEIWKGSGRNLDDVQFSLGMSGDFKLARQAAKKLGLQAPMIRLGTAIFGERQDIK